MLLMLMIFEVLLSSWYFTTNITHLVITIWLLVFAFFSGHTDIGFFLLFSFLYKKIGMSIWYQVLVSKRYRTVPGIFGYGSKPNHPVHSPKLTNLKDMFPTALRG
ncbi:hypothetical protein HanHA300_Chr03g0085321 [Helianthus annuus]|nr:hypothetical protein HanHA300_Chr03g0085321 [Helianthus annuus]KAJ0607448.1 hypothetical protein HanHA89_Chr03g0096881 [Helianthus annuus]KAJ0767505.1 hypothetical protein HanLR1_Chr03g0090171 [Helianthus annuus]KAJ0773338.1 hypothetical protein HanOQP8_Chr03g0098101 [Helianthus annuus]